MKKILILLMAAVLMSGMVLTLTGCGSAGNEGTETADEQSEEKNGEVNMEAEKNILIEVVDEETAEDVIEKMHEFVEGAVISGAEKYSDEVGEGIQITAADGSKYNVYMYSSGVIYGIKDTASGEYLYAVYE